MVTYRIGCSGWSYPHWPRSLQRFHGVGSGARGYGERRLREWGERLDAVPIIERVCAYFNNDVGGHAPRDAMYLRGIVAALHGTG